MARSAGQRSPLPVAVNVSPFQEMLASPSQRAAPSPLRILSDSLIRRGHPAFPNIVRLIYRTAKQVRGVQGLEKALEELGRRFAHTSTSAEENAEEKAEENAP